jgi:ABC-type multidrug transport system ATPase subunit
MRDFGRDNSEIVSMDSVTIRYLPNAAGDGDGDGDPAAVDALSLRLDRGDRLGLLGVNGAGKSAVFKAIALPETVIEKGEMKVNGRLNTIEQMWRVASSGMVGYVPQEGGMVDYVSVETVLKRFKSIRMTTYAHQSGAYNTDTLSSHSHSHTHSHSYLVNETDDNTTGIISSKYSAYSIQSLSGGNRRRLSVALANIGKPLLLLMDEPTAGQGLPLIFDSFIHRHVCVHVS